MVELVLSLCKSTTSVVGTFAIAKEPCIAGLETLVRDIVAIISNSAQELTLAAIDFQVCKNATRSLHMQKQYKCSCPTQTESTDHSNHYTFDQFL